MLCRLDLRRSIRQICCRVLWRSRSALAGRVLAVGHSQGQGQRTALSSYLPDLVRPHYALALACSAATPMVTMCVYVICVSCRSLNTALLTHVVSYFPIAVFLKPLRDDCGRRPEPVRACDRPKNGPFDRPRGGAR